MWPGADVDVRNVGASHVYLHGWDLFTDQERERLLANLDSTPQHMGLDTATRATLKSRANASRNGRKASVVYTDPDTATALIEQVARDSKYPDRTRAALYVMYCCGMSAAQLCQVQRKNLVTTDNTMLLLTKGYIYVLTPTVRELVERWLPHATKPDRPFARLNASLQQYNFLAETYQNAKSN
jgi:integrase